MMWAMRIGILSKVEEATDGEQGEVVDSENSYEVTYFAQ